MNELQNFTNGIFNLDIKVENEQVLFSAEQVAKSLGFEKNETRNGRTTKSIRWSRVNTYLPKSCPQVGTGSFISEPMVYKLAFKANNAVSEKFTDWLAVEVLPTIRNHGAYMTDSKAQDVLNGSGLADLLLQAGNQIKQLESEKEAMKIELEEATERTRYLDLILESPDKMTTTQIAFDYGMGAPTFNKLLASLKIQRKVNGQWILYRQYMGKGYTKTETFPITHKDGRRGTTTNTVWTQKGREFLYRKLKKNGYLPLVEQDDLAS